MWHDKTMPETMAAENSMMPPEKNYVNCLFYKPAKYEFAFSRMMLWTLVISLLTLYKVALFN